MQIDFVKPLDNPSGHSGWLEKKESLRKNWKTRYFYLRNGILKYFGKGPHGSAEDSPTNQTGEGVDIKGEISLINADVMLFEEVQIHLNIRGDKKGIHHLRAKSSAEAAEWYTAIAKEIQFSSIQLLHQGSRSPEIIEWYYQYQSELYRKHSFLSKPTEITLHLFSPYSDERETTTDNPALFHVSMTEDRNGLLLSTVAGNRKGFNRLESIHNGRVITWSDITGAVLHPEGWGVLDPVTNHFYFTLITQEDELFVEMEANGVSWLQAVQEMVTFFKIPKPAARTISVNFAADRVMSSTMNNLMEFSANSGAIFTCSSEVPLLIEGFNSVAHKFPAVLEIGSRLNNIMKLIPDLKCNKEAALNFGERMEDIIRMLGDADHGILHNAQDSERTLLNFHLGTLNNKLNDIIKYFYTQSRPGWLVINLSSRTQDSAKFKYNTYDHDLLAIVNTLVKALHLSPPLQLLTKKDYTMAVDVRKSIEALGGLQVIFQDVAKERTLARLIQADGGEVHSELADFLDKVNANGSGNGQGSNSPNGLHSSTSVSSSMGGWRASFDGGAEYLMRLSQSSSMTPGVNNYNSNSNTSATTGGIQTTVPLSYDNSSTSSMSSTDNKQSSFACLRRFFCCCGLFSSSRQPNNSSDSSYSSSSSGSHGKVAMRASRQRQGLKEPLVTSATRM